MSNTTLGSKIYIQNDNESSQIATATHTIEVEYEGDTHYTPVQSCVITLSNDDYWDGQGNEPDGYWALRKRDNTYVSNNNKLSKNNSAFDFIIKQPFDKVTVTLTESQDQGVFSDLKERYTTFGLISSDELTLDDVTPLLPLPNGTMQLTDPNQEAVKFDTQTWTSTGGVNASSEFDFSADQIRYEDASIDYQFSIPFDNGVGSDGSIQIHYLFYIANNAINQSRRRNPAIESNVEVRKGVSKQKTFDVSHLVRESGGFFSVCGC